MGAQQFACNRHTTAVACLADRSHFCAPLRHPIPSSTPSFDCVVFGLPWTHAYFSLFDLGAAFCCPGSECELQWRCLSMDRPWGKYSRDVGSATEVCAKVDGCIFDQLLDSCVLEANPVYGVARPPRNYSLTFLGNCNTSSFLNKSMDAVRNLQGCKGIPSWMSGVMEHPGGTGVWRSGILLGVES